MITYKPEISEYNSDKIIELLDDNFDSLESIKVALFIDVSDKKFIYKLFQKLYECGCQVTVISSASRLFNPYNNREIFEYNNVAICKLEDHSIVNTFHPLKDALIIDLTGKSLNDSFIHDADGNTYYDVITAMDKT